MLHDVTVHSVKLLSILNESMELTFVIYIARW